MNRRKLSKLIENPSIVAALRTIAWIAVVVYVASMIASKVPTLPDGPRLRKILPFSSNPADAIGRITIGNSGCTASIIGPIASDDTKIHILSAAHCVKLGAKGRMRLKDGREMTITCVSRDDTSDAAWFEADKPSGEVPNVALATTVPQDGSAIWHQGYGIDKPNNREVGVFRGVTVGRPQYVFDLSVSPGDSGGGIVLNARGEVLSPVCCTTKLSGRGTVWGATSLAAEKIRPKILRSDDTYEVFHPVQTTLTSEWPSPISEEPPLAKTNAPDDGAKK